MSSEAYVWRHSWRVMRLGPAASPAFSTRRAILPDMTERSTTLPACGRPWRSQAAASTWRRLSAIGGRRWVPASLLGRRTRSREAMWSSSRTGPLEAVDLRTTQAGVEGDRVGEAILGLESCEQGSGLGCEGDTHAWLLVVGWQLDEPQGIAGDQAPARRGGPGVDVRGDRDVLG